MGVDQAKLKQSLDNAYGGEQLPFCRDATRTLRDRELCTLSQAEQQRCPAFKQLCAAKQGKETPRAQTEQQPDRSVSPLLSGAAEAMFWALIAALVVALAVAVWRMQRSRNSQEDAKPQEDVPEPSARPTPTEVVAGDKDVQRLLDKARRAADAGQLDVAIDAAHAAAIQGLAASGHIEVEADRTNGDYLRALRKTPPLFQDFRTIVGQVEVAQFGGTAPSRGAFDQVLQQVLGMLRRLAVLSLWLALAFSAVGCRSRQSNETEERSPSGLYTFKQILKDQGAKVHTRVTPLSKLAEEDVGEIVVLSTRLEDADEKRLLSWVNQGGSLMVVGSSSFSEPAEVELRWQSCGTKAERPKDSEQAPLTVAVLGERGLSITAKETAGVLPHVDMTCGDQPYITTSYYGDGTITFVPEPQLLSNASLSVADNAQLVAELFSAPDSTIELVGSWTGDGSESPLQALKAAGMMPIMGQLFAVALLLALRRGTSFGRRRDPSRFSRRAFADHVRAVGSNYARANAGQLATGHYCLLLLDQLRERACPGQSPSLFQLAAALARRVGRPEGELVQLLVEAKGLSDEQGEGTGVGHALISKLEQLSLQVGGNS